MRGVARLSKREVENTRFAWLINIPIIVYIVFVLVFPILWGIYISFTNKTIGGVEKFIGFKNYERLLTDKEYLRSIWNTLRFTFFSVSLKALLGTFMALALNNKFR